MTLNPDPLGPPDWFREFRGERRFEPLYLGGRRPPRLRRMALVLVAASAFLAGVLVDRAALGATPRSGADIPAFAFVPVSGATEGGEPDRLRTEAPHASLPPFVPPPARAVSGPIAGPTSVAGTLRGLASWYCGPASPCTAGHPASCLCAAAGPALRAWLGAGWRGQVVVVSSGGRSVLVTLWDWCACGSGRSIDLYAAAFERLAPLSRGVVDVEIRRG